MGTYGTNDQLRSDDHMYYKPEDSFSEVIIYKHILDTQTSDSIFFQLNASCKALPRGVHRETVPQEKRMSLELSCFWHQTVLLRYTGYLQ